MKVIQILGSRAKSDFVIYLSHTIATMGKRVLLVDATSNNEYLYSYVRHEEGESLYDLQNIEILIAARSWNEVVEKLAIANETVDNFDCIIVDSNDSSTIYNDWVKFHHTFYVSDNNRFTITQDLDILNNFADETGRKHLSRIHFESAFNVPNDYIELLLNKRISFIEYDPIEYDDQEQKIRNYMQHEYSIPYNRLNKGYKKLIKTLVMELFDLGDKDIEASIKSNPLGLFFKRFRSKTHQEPNKNGLLPVPKLVAINENNSVTTGQDALTEDINKPGKSKEVIGG